MILFDKRKRVHKVIQFYHTVTSYAFLLNKYDQQAIAMTIDTMMFQLASGHIVR